jgi:hypothetical protein
LGFTDLFGSVCLWFSSYLVNFSWFFWWGVKGTELRASHLLGKRSTTWATPPASLAIFFFGGGVVLGFELRALHLQGGALTAALVLVISSDIFSAWLAA